MIFEVGGVVALKRDIELDHGAVVAAGTHVVVRRVYVDDDVEYSVELPGKPDERFLVGFDEVEVAR